MDAEAYSEASRNVLKILWHVGTSTHISHVGQWAKARSSAFEALTQYEVSPMNCWNILSFLNPFPILITLPLSQMLI